MTWTSRSAGTSRMILFKKAMPHSQDDKIYCVYVAPDEDIIFEHARCGGFPGLFRGQQAGDVELPPLGAPVRSEPPAAQSNSRRGAD